MITECLFTKQYYNKIIFCSTSGKLDKISEILSTSFNTPIEYIKEEHLLPYFKHHFKRKFRYYAMVKHVLYKIVEINEEMASRQLQNILIIKVNAIFSKSTSHLMRNVLKNKTCIFYELQIWDLKASLPVDGTG